MLSQYFHGVFTLCTFIALALAVAHPRLRIASNFGAGILMICAILLPLVDIIRDFNAQNVVDDILGEFQYDGATDSSIELAFESGISEYVAQKHDVDADCVKVMVDGFDMESLKAKRIYVTLSGDAVRLDYKRIERELAAEFTLGGECEVSLKIG